MTCKLSPCPWHDAKNSYSVMHPEEPTLTTEPVISANARERLVAESPVWGPIVLAELDRLTGKQ